MRIASALALILAITAFTGWQAQPEGATAGNGCAQSFAAHSGLAGTWTGTWENHTFLSSGNLTADLTINDDCTAVAMVTGVFNQPGTHTINATYHDDGTSTVIVITNHPFFGNGTVTIDENGNITIQGTGAQQGIESYNGTGTLQDGHLEIDLEFQFSGGGSATESIELTQTGTPTPTDTPAPTDTPTAEPTETPTPTPAGEELIWGDNNCSGAADPVDALLTLRFDAGLSTNTGACPPMGDIVDVNGTARPWGDIDCSGAADPVDALKLLRFDAGLNVSQGSGCPALGAEVTVIEG